MSILAMGARILREIWANWTIDHIGGPSSKSNWLAYHSRSRFFQKGQLMPYYGVSLWRVAREGSGEIGP